MKDLVNLFTNENLFVLFIGTTIVLAFVSAVLRTVYYFGERLAIKAELHPLGWPITFSLSLITLVVLVGTFAWDVVTTPNALWIIYIYMGVAGIILVTIITKTCIRFETTLEIELDKKLIQSITVLVFTTGLGFIGFSIYKLFIA